MLKAPRNFTLLSNTTKRYGMRTELKERRLIMQYCGGGFRPLLTQLVVTFV